MDNTTDTAITKAFLDDGGVFTDETTDFNDAVANDVQLMPTTEDVDDAFYYGSSNKFRGLNLNIGTAGVGNTIVWEYWDGLAWTSLTVTDLTNGFTVLTIHNHKIDDTTNTITSTNATDQATLNTLLNEIKADYNAHRVSTTFHDSADTINVISSSNATDLTTSITLANEIKTDYNAHRSQSGVHPYDDSENAVTAADATNLVTFSKKEREQGKTIRISHQCVGPCVCVCVCLAYEHCCVSPGISVHSDKKKSDER